MQVPRSDAESKTTTGWPRYLKDLCAISLRWAMLRKQAMSVDFFSYVTVLPVQPSSPPKDWSGVRSVSLVGQQF
jgi:hypothetical protein